MTPPRSVVITGASGAIGGALALAYAAPGVTLHLQGRQQERLAALATQCREKGAEVRFSAFDITTDHALIAWVEAFCAQGAPDLLIANHGVNTDVGPQGAGESWEAVENLLAVNVRATFVLVHTLLPHMRRRRQGQIALMSSLAAFFGLPVTPAYSASKAAVKAYGEGLRGWLMAEGIAVNVIMPGYVDSAMCRAMPGPKPFLWLPERAAQAIRRGLSKNRPRITFPFPLDFGCWLLSVIRPADATRILRWLDYHA